MRHKLLDNIGIRLYKIYQVITKLIKIKMECKEELMSYISNYDVKVFMITRFSSLQTRYPSFLILMAN